MANKDIQALMKQVRRLPGWRVTEGRKHYKVWPPGSGQCISVVHGPRNGWRELKNIRAKLRRAGADI